MTSTRTSLRTAMAAACVGLACGAPAVYAQNPCAPRANPCAAKSPGAAKNPCAAKSDRIDPKLVTRPKGTRLATGDRAELIKLGQQLWSDTKLSTNGASCNTCHANGAAFSGTFAKPFPHHVQMALERAGLKKIALDEMVQLCMLVPMAAKPLAWDSRELAALTAYTAEVQKRFKPMGEAEKSKNPCAAKK